MTFGDLTATFRDLLPDPARPVVAYCGLFAIARALPPPADRLPRAVLQCLLDAVGPGRTLLMPTYTPGFNDDRIDLDQAVCNTGMVNELLRTMPGTKRTASAFFSFAARGPQAAELASLRPVDAWGSGSVFDWIEGQNAQLMVVGVPWAMCSFLHRAEWNVGVPYRYCKTFSSVAQIDDRSETLTERLFVRSLSPLALNVWHGLDEILSGHGMRRLALGRSHVAAIPAQDLLDAIAPLLDRDPFRFVQHPAVLREAFGKPTTPSSQDGSEGGFR